LKLVFILLCIGFVISVVLSWYYDFTPEGLERIKSTREAKEVPVEKPLTLNAWKIATIISVVVIIGLILVNILGRRGKVEDLALLDKSIAVLPFKSLSDDPEKQYLADGIMDAILLHLSKIEDLRVMPRTSIEQYRETDKTVTAICQELDVVFLLEGSFQKYGDHARLIVQLIEPGQEGHIWAEEYDRNWTDIFSVQSEVAQAIARELQAVITPEEKQLIERTPTTSLTAYDFYQRGREEYMKYWLDNANKDALERAEGLYNKALEHDSTFAQAYTGLAQVYKVKYYWKTFLTENFLDSMLILANKALSFDDQLPEAYLIRGEYYEDNNKIEQAEKEYEKAIKFNPNFWEAYWGIGMLYFQTDIVKALDNYHKAASLHRGSFLPKIYRKISWVYGNNAGFREKAIHYEEEAFKLDDDSSEYLWNLSQIEESHGNFEKAIELGRKCLVLDSTKMFIILRLGVNHSFIGQYEEYLEYLKKYEKILKTLERPDPWQIFTVGHAYWINGFKEEAENIFNTGLEFYDKWLELDRLSSQSYFIFFNLAAIHAFLGDRDKAYYNLKVFNQNERFPLWMVKDLKNNPMLDPIRDEPEFQQIVRDVEAKYQAEHERVRNWLEKNDML
jgi:TolB-like protein/Tfp pilus assembly protein PilF